MTILDLAGVSQNTISFITNFGHRVYSDDLLLQLDRFFANGDFYENQANHQLAGEFLDNVLDFPIDHFDGVLLWDALEFIAPPLLEQVVRRIRNMVRPGGTMFALFHAQERLNPVPIYSYRIADSRTIGMVNKGQRQPAQVFNNRGLEKLFQDFESVKFFLTRDHLREVIVRR